MSETARMSSFEALLASKAKEKAREQEKLAAKRLEEEARIQQEKEAKLAKQKAHEEEAKRMRLLSRKREIEAAEQAKRDADARAHLEKRLAETRKDAIKKKVLGTDKQQSNSPMAKIKSTTHPSLQRESEPGVNSNRVPQSSGHRSVSAALPTNVLTRKERKALADAREFGVAPSSKLAAQASRGGWKAGTSKVTLEEEGISQLARIAAERAGLGSRKSSAASTSSSSTSAVKGQGMKGKGRESDPPPRTVNRNGERSASTASSRNGREVDGARRGDMGRAKLSVDGRGRGDDRDPQRASSSRLVSRSSAVSSSSNGKKRTRSPSPDSDDSLDSDDLDRGPKRRSKGGSRETSRSASDGGRRSAGGGGILASLGFDAYGNFSRSGKDRDHYLQQRVHSDEDSDLDMEADAATIRREEAKAARLAREADRREEILEKQRREEKLRRKMGK